MMQNPINKEADPKAYAKAQASEVMSFLKFVDHIADHGGHSRGKVKGVLSDMCACLVEMLLEGKKVLLDELGDFWISLSSDGAASIDTFTANNIKAVNIVFTPGDDFQNLVHQAEFNQVSSRVAQAATLKAEKEGATTVDLEAAKKKSTSSSTSGDNTDTSDTQSGSQSGSQTGSDTDENLGF